MSSSAMKTFDRREVEDYEKRRYRGLDQKLVDQREKKILEKTLDPLFQNGNPPQDRKESSLFLDAPCGYGRFSRLILSRGAGLVNCDLSFSMVERTVEKIKDSRSLGGVVSDLRRGLPFKPAVFDYVFSMRFFHHLHESEDRLAVLREFARVANKGIILSYYRFNRLHAFQRIFRRLLKRTRRRIMMIPRDVFEKEAAAAGLIVDSVRPLFRGIHAQHIVLLKKRRA